MSQYQIKIDIDTGKPISVSGHIENLTLALGWLEQAKFALVDYHRAKEQSTKVQDGINQKTDKET